MPLPNNLYTVPFKIRSYEVDVHQETSISTICNYFQEAAGLHAKKLNFDITDLQKQGLTWILYKLQVKVFSFPKRWQNVQVKTWPSAGDGLRAYRDYELYDDRNEQLAVGLSQWMVLDIQRKRPVKMPEELLEGRFKTDHHVLPIHKQNLKNISSNHCTYIGKVGYNDLDMNQHVNNVRYIDWATGFRSSENIKFPKCREIIIQYVAEATINDNIYIADVNSEKQRDLLNHTIFKNENRKVIANAQTVWSS